jgi:hypothetical protein
MGSCLSEGLGQKPVLEFREQAPFAAECDRQYEAMRTGKHPRTDSNVPCVGRDSEILMTYV